MGDGKRIACRQCNHYHEGHCKAYNTIVSNADLVYMLCPASDRIQTPVEADPPSFVVGLGKKVAAESQSSSKSDKRRGKRKNKPAKVG